VNGGGVAEGEDLGGEEPFAVYRGGGRGLTGGGGSGWWGRESMLRAIAR